MTGDGYDVEIDADVDPEVEAAATRAVTELAARDHLGLPRSYRSAWRRAAAHDLTDDRMDDL